MGRSSAKEAIEAFDAPQKRKIGPPLFYKILRQGSQSADAAAMPGGSECLRAEGLVDTPIARPTNAWPSTGIRAASAPGTPRPAGLHAIGAV